MYKIFKFCGAISLEDIRSGSTSPMVHLAQVFPKPDIVTKAFTNK